MHDKNTGDKNSVSRRQFVQSSAVIAAGTIAAGPLTSAAKAVTKSPDIRVGLIGCGGRGTGAAHNALEASDRVQIVALGDLFTDRLDGCRRRLADADPRGDVDESKCFVGFDAYRQVVAEDLDYVILATPPGFRPLHFEAAVDAGRHVFMEKPVAVDPAGIRTVLAANEEADRKSLSVVAGTQRRHEACYRQALKKIADGDIGEVIGARCYWNMGGLWMNEPRAEWTDMEWQVRNWLYFTWLSGDHIVEQHVHNIDVCNWAIGAHPISAMGMGGRQVRTDSNYGNIFDHFAIDFEYPNGVFVTSMCRQTDGCASRVEERIAGSNGRALLRPGFARIEGEHAWQFDSSNPNPYVEEHRDLIGSITGSGRHWNEAKQVAESTLSAIMGRMSAYTGKELTWEQALNSTLDLSPEQYAFGSMEVRPVAVPGRTPLV